MQVQHFQETGKTGIVQFTSKTDIQDNTNDPYRASSSYP
jgi:hypothetical protein